MRFVRRTTVNPRDPRDYRLYVSQTNDIIMGGRASLQLPVGADADRSGLVSNGLIRFNTETDNVEVYQGSTWRALRYAEATKIIQQTAGTGDGASIYYGPLNAAYDPTNVSNENNNFDGQNIIVLVENVFQVWTTNYTIVQNPTPTVTSHSSIISSGATTINVVPTNNASTNFTDTIPNIKVNAVLTAVDGSSNPIFAGNTKVSTIGTSSFTIDTATIADMPAGTVITMTLPSGYYLSFTSPAPLGITDPKYVTVLHGFDK
jgi:hypothetical protein